MARVIEAPNQLTKDDNDFCIFLAGSIEMGTAVEWQQEVIDRLKGNNVIIFNPRRQDWDSSWEQSTNNPKFVEQVTWELDALDAADIIILYLAPGTKSPISLLELGLHANSKKLVVVCPDEFWRSGNVNIVCKRYGIEKVESLEALYERLNL